ncbi:MAG TPA: protease inhibitor I42 family protein [Polyangiaceae bacterium]
MFRAAVAVAATSLAIACVACAGCRHEEVPAERASVDAGPSDMASAGAVAVADVDVDARVDAPEGSIVHAADDGKTFALARGSVLTFSLARHAGTGFEWSATPLDGGVLVLKGERASERTSDEPGAEKNDVYRFVGEAPGTVTVEMKLRRPWGDQPPVKTLRVVVEVR